MNNYQLYRTNVLLGGQMKWDLIIDSSQNTLYVSDFHLSPISNNTPYTYKSDEYLIKNKHQDNVKAYYAANKGHFYNSCLDSEFSHNWPIICNDNEHITTYSNTYDMGCRRSKRYNEYKKQFEFLCPLWIEHITDDIMFKINIKDVDSNTVLASNALVLTANDVTNNYHNKFIQYFNNYASDAGLYNGNDDVLNIVFKTNTATVTGLNVATGIFETQHISSLIDNITNREKPLMEFDNMLIQSFVSSTTICNQLINFNLCFNINDIMSGGITNMLNGEDIIISVDVYMGKQLLEKRDFYTEYNNINRAVKSEKETDITDNVLNYLRDYEFIDLIDKNKFCQSICHWSLCDNPDYIFNLYEGFAGITVEEVNDKTVVYENMHQYRNAPNTFVSKADKTQNSTGWITHFEITKWNDFYKYVNNTKKNKTVGTYLFDNKFINNIRYNYIPQINEGVYVIGLSMPGKLLSSIVSSFKCTEIVKHTLYLMYKDDLILLLTNNVDKLSFGGLYEALYTLCNNDGLTNISDEYAKMCIEELFKMMKSKIAPTIIMFDKSILYTTINNPSIDASEITYYKDDNAHNWVMRYDGKIKPTFTTSCNTLYYKDYLNEKQLKDSVYTKYNTDKFEPLYPSIRYCAIKKLTDWTYDNLPEVMVTQYDEPVSVYPHNFEYSWFNNSKCIILEPTLSFTYVNTPIDGVYKSVDDIIIECLQKYYNIDNVQLITYIKSLYKYTNNWEYYSITNVDDYIYTISMQLK